MKQYKIRLSDETAVFYEKAARQAGRNVERCYPTRFSSWRVSWPWKRSIKRGKKKSCRVSAGLLWVRFPFAIHSRVTTGMTMGLRLVVLKR